MPTLNRFPLLGLWAKEAALRLNYSPEEAEALGHAYAVLYAIRAQSQPHSSKGKQGGAAAPAPAPGAESAQPQIEELDFGGDLLEIARDGEGRVRGRVGRAALQTSRTYQASVQSKFPAGYYQKLEKGFRDVLQTLPPATLQQNRVIYKLYDQWKKSCAAGRLVDLDKLLQWCQERLPKTT